MAYRRSRAVLTGTAVGEAKGAEGRVEMARALKAASRLESLPIPAPGNSGTEELRELPILRPLRQAVCSAPQQPPAALSSESRELDGQLKNEAHSDAQLRGFTPIPASPSKAVSTAPTAGATAGATATPTRRTRAYVAGRTSGGKSTRETTRCPKRHIAREPYGVQ